MKLRISLLIAFAAISIVFSSLAVTSPKASHPKLVSPCYDMAVTDSRIDTGCPSISRKDNKTISFKDGTTLPLTVGPGTGACGQNTSIGACPDCGQYYTNTKECWPKFLTGCSGNTQESSGCWTGSWAQTVVSQTANQANPICCNGIVKPVTTCQDGPSATYYVEHTCPC